MKLMGLNFPNLKMRIKYPNHKIVQKITCENTHEMKAHLESERYLKYLTTREKGFSDRPVYVPTEESLLKNLK